jgi:hypothetical protein
VGAGRGHGKPDIKMILVKPAACFPCLGGLDLGLDLGPLEPTAADAGPGGERQGGRQGEGGRGRNWGRGGLEADAVAAVDFWLLAFLAGRGSSSSGGGVEAVRSFILASHDQ